MSTPEDHQLSLVTQGQDVTKARTTQFRFVFPIITFMAILASGNAVDGQGKNSTRKIRVKPTPEARKIGTGVQWETSFNDAIAKSAETGKPIFWYVPTLPGTFMDRKAEIDRYMMAGPFSWPQNVDILNQQFVPLRAAPKRAEQKKFNLVPFEFVEPGFLILKSDQTEMRRVDRITTMHTDWFHKLLAVPGVEIPAVERPEAIQQLWTQLRSGKYKNAVQPEGVQAPVPPKGHEAEYLMLKGMLQFRAGNHDGAIEMWNAAVTAQPNSPLAWKAAAEAQKFGPFYRGFEVARSIPKSALQSGIQSAGSTAPENVYDEQAIWKRSTDFLLGMQRSDGGWVDSDYDYGGTDSLPNVHVAVTSLCGMALLSAKPHLPKQAKQIDNAIRLAVGFVSDEKNLNRDDRDEILWALAFRTRFLARVLKWDESVRDQLFAAGKDLQDIQTKQGSWYHEYSNPFATATALGALHEARKSGFETDSEVVKKGVAALAGDRFSNGAYPYSTTRSKKVKRGDESHLAQSAGRMPLCELALQVWGASDQKSIVTAVETSLKQHEATLETALKYDDHTSNMGYGGFFFWYDMRGRSEAISQITNDAVRKKLQDQQRKLILELPEIDGCFVDSHELGRCYGTAMGLLTLSHCSEK